MANQLAAMHAISPNLTEAVAGRISIGELHDKALKDLGAFVHRTVIEDEHAYAVRIDDGVVLDAHEQIQRARRHLTAAAQAQLDRAAGLRAREARARARHARRPRESQGRQGQDHRRDPLTAHAPAATPTSTTAGRTSPTRSG